MADIKGSQGVNSKNCPENLPYLKLIKFISWTKLVCERPAKKYNKAIYHAKQSAAVWIWRGNELSNHIKSDSLGPVHLQISLFWVKENRLWSYQSNRSRCAHFVIFLILDLSQIFS